MRRSGCGPRGRRRADPHPSRWAPTRRYDRSDLGRHLIDTERDLPAVTGYVAWWEPEEGYGEVRSDDGRVVAWAHYSVLRMEGYRVLRRGQRVSFAYEHARQDGYATRATAVVPLPG